MSLPLMLLLFVGIGRIGSTVFAKDSEAEAHWAFQTPTNHSLPSTRDTRWCRSPVDRFILARLESQGFRPSPPATRRALVRRVYLDLIGLPPTPAEVDAYLSDPRPDAYAQLVDRLLQSSAYAERWGRWWLDIARYADSNGQDENKYMANAWRYRDWIIRAFNIDLPFDQFIQQQVAGDLLPTEGLSEREVLERSVATGFLVLGPKMLAEQDKPKLVMDVIDEQIDTVSRAFLGLTVSCARCHDHKFDPVSARDYYALAGIFKSTKTLSDLAFVSKWNERSLRTREEMAKAQANPAKTNDATAAVDPLALAVTEDKPQDLPVHIRGSHLTLEKTSVPRGAPAVLCKSGALTIPPDHSGRLELARWLTSPGHPLTARVIMNRLWQSHFGEGLVRTPDNFGLRGERPTHPELLDWLALQFEKGAWSLKAMQRLLLLSAVYQQSSENHEARTVDRDPDNRLLSRFPRQRLEAEVLRDSLLYLSGRLNSATGGSLTTWKNAEYVPGDLTPFDSLRRSVYLPVIRDRVYEVFTIFDFANPSLGCAQRKPTTVAHQALFFMNSPLVKASARQIAKSLAVEVLPITEEQRIHTLYLRVLGRKPGRAEEKRAEQFLRVAQRSAAATEEQAWSALTQSLLACSEFVYRN